MKYSVIKNKLLSTLLAVTLLLLLIPAAAYAAAADTVIQPVQPLIAGISITPVVGSNRHAAVVIPGNSVTDAITKAIDDAKAQGKSANGIGVALNISLPDTASSLGITVTQDVMKNLVNAGIKHLEINGSIRALNLDLEAVKEIQKQSIGDVTINISPTKAFIGTIPAYNISFSYINKGKTESITNFGSGTIMVSRPYKTGENAAPYIPGGREGQQNAVAAPFIPGGREGQQNIQAAPFILGGLN